MFIKLLCIEDVVLENYDEIFEIYEGNIVSAILKNNGIFIEFPSGMYARFCISDIDNNFISAFDEERYDDIYRRKYKRRTNCKSYINDGRVLKLGNVTVKIHNKK